jgi:uncharacterized protein YjbI with pentapeptide repeats
LGRSAKLSRKREDSFLKSAILIIWVRFKYGQNCLRSRMVKQFKAKAQKIVPVFRLIAKAGVWIIWEFSGLRFICEKIIPPKLEKRKAPTFFIWLVGLYIALFGIASQRYENRIDVIENRANAIFAQISYPNSRKATISRIPRVQNMSCPLKPELLHPASVFTSLFKDGHKYEPIVELLAELVEDWKQELDNTDLRYAHLEKTNLDNARLRRTILIGANLSYASLNRADLAGAYLVQTKLKGASLIEANLSGVSRGDLAEYPAIAKIFPGMGSIIPSFKELQTFSYPKDVADQLLEARTLYRAEIDKPVKDVIQAQSPKLLQSLFPAMPQELRLVPQ